MDREPLLPSRRLQQPSPVGSLCSFPEDTEITIQVPISSSLEEFKERLIFGPSPSSSGSNADAETLQKLDTEKQKSWLIDPDYAPPKGNLHRSLTAPAIPSIYAVQQSEDTRKPPPIVSASIVRQGVLFLILYLTLGVIIYWLNRHKFKASETHPVVDALYFCVVTMCTIGYGDITPDSAATKLFSITFVLVGFGFIDILLTGMVSYVLDLQENHLLRTIKSGNSHDPRSYLVDVKKGRLRIRIKVTLALAVVILCIGIGVGVMHFVEKLDWMDSFYLSVMSVTTVGYGDRAFNSLSGRIFASIWLLVSTLAVARAFLFLTEARVDKRHRKMVKWVLNQKLTVAQFLSADVDHNGFISKSEFAIYKLKEMGKITEKDISQICEQFDRLDKEKCGRISLSNIMENNQTNNLVR